MLPELLTQRDFIALHKVLKKQSAQCVGRVRQAHFEHVLLGLQKIIESFGPTPEYYAWLCQTSPDDRADDRTFVIDL